MKHDPSTIELDRNGSSLRTLLCLFVGGAAALTAWTASAAPATFQPAAEAALASPIAAAANPPPANATPAQPEFVPGEILVGFQPGAAGRADAVRNGIGAQKLKEWPALQAQHWRLPPGLTVERAVQILSANPNVNYAEPNYIWHANESIPNDPHRGDLWGMHNAGQDGGVNDADIDALEAWQVAPGSGPVVIAVIDTGIDYMHPDLAARIWTNPGEIPGNGIDDDGNGYTDDVFGYDFYNNDGDPFDDNGHGTHVSGTIAGIGNNGIGVIGVAGLNPNVRLMPVKFLGAGGSAPTDIAVSCVLYAASFKDAAGKPIVRISNNSWGGGGKSKTLENAIKNSGALFCAAAGNIPSGTLHYPAGYNLANVLAVAATDRTDALAGFSNFGSWVHVAAPGVSVLSTYPESEYRVFNGTSMATPHVAGAAALLLSANASWSNDQLKQRLLATVDSRASLAGKVSSGGRLNIAKALNAPALSADTAPVALSGLTVGSGLQPNSVALEWTDANDPPGYLYEVRYRPHPELSDPAAAPTSWSETDWNNAASVFGEPLPQAGQNSLMVDGLSPQAVYSFAVRVLNRSGILSAISEAGAAKTPPTGWRPEIVSTGNSGYHNSIAFSPGGTPATAFSYSDSAGQQMRFAHRPGGQWTTETIATGSHEGISLAFDPAGQASASSVSGGNLNFSTRASDGSWTVLVVEASQARGDFTSLACDSFGNPSIAYRIALTAGGTTKYPLKFAWRAGSTWRNATVLLSTVRYLSLAYNPDGNPVIAYSTDLDENGLLDTLGMVAGTFSPDRSAISWSSPEIITSGATGNGVFVNLKFDGAEATLVQQVGSQIHYLRKSALGWTAETIVTGRYPALGYDGEQPVVVYSADAYLQVARRIGPGQWQTEWQPGVTGFVDEGEIWRLPSLAIQSGAVALSYQSLGQLKFAEPGEALEPAPKQLVVQAWTDKTEYINGEIMRSYSLVTLGTADGPAIEKANVRFEMIDPKGLLWTAEGETDSNGVFEAIWKVNAGRAGKGTYRITSFVSKLGYLGGRGQTTFVVK